MQSQKDNDLPSVDSLLESLRPIAQAMACELPKDVDKETMKMLIETFIVLNTFNNKLKSVLDDSMKPFFHETVPKAGNENEKGGFTFDVDGLSVLREKRVDTLPDEEKLRALLKTHKLDVMSCFDVAQSVVLNPSKLQLLIDTGKLEEEEVKALHGVGWAIKAAPNKTLKEKIDSIFKKSRKKTEKKERERR